MGLTVSVFLLIMVCAVAIGVAVAAIMRADEAINIARAGSGGSGVIYPAKSTEFGVTNPAQPGSLVTFDMSSMGPTDQTILAYQGGGAGSTIFIESPPASGQDTLTLNNLAQSMSNKTMNHTKLFSFITEGNGLITATMTPGGNILSVGGTNNAGIISIQPDNTTTGAVMITVTFNGTGFQNYSRIPSMLIVPASSTMGAYGPYSIGTVSTTTFTFFQTLNTPITGGFAPYFQYHLM
jgi:hypothetical protein